MSPVASTMTTAMLMNVPVRTGTERRAATAAASALVATVLLSALSIDLFG